jgi:hypothetical protein
MLKQPSWIAGLRATLYPLKPPFLAVAAKRRLQSLLASWCETLLQ